MSRRHRFGAVAAIAMVLSCTAMVGAQPGATKEDIAAPRQSLDAIFARYVAVGRSDVHITLAAAGAYASARVTPRADGSFACDVGGLRTASTDGDPARAERMLAGLVIHEATHCLTSPYTAALDHGQAEPVSAAANLLVLLTLESISDTRAVIEIFRKDGVVAAREFVAMALPARLRPASAGHSTAHALRAALEIVTQQPSSVASDTQAFAVALGSGRAAADRSLRELPAAQRGSGRPEPASVAATAARLDLAMARAEQAFRSGRFANDAATIRAAIGLTTPGDQHVFVAADSTVRTQPVLGAETAHSLAELESMLASSDTPEHRLAVAWLRREGQLDAASLARCRGAFTRLIKTFSDGSEPQNARAQDILGETIEKTRTGAALSALLDNAADALKSMRDPMTQAQLTQR